MSLESEYGREQGEAEEARLSWESVQRDRRRKKLAEYIGIAVEIYYVELGTLPKSLSPRRSKVNEGILRVQRAHKRLTGSYYFLREDIGDTNGDFGCEVKDEDKPFSELDLLGLEDYILDYFNAMEKYPKNSENRKKTVDGIIEEELIFKERTGDYLKVF